MKHRSLRVRFISTIAVVYVVLGALSLLAFQLVIGKSVRSLGTRFAAKQALLERGKLMSAIERDLSLSMKMAQSPLLNRWALDESDGQLKRLALEELESYRRMLRGGSLFFAHDRSKHYYFLDGKKGEPFDKPRYSLSPTSPDDVWYFRTMRSTEGFELNLDHSVPLGITMVWFNVALAADGNTRSGLVGSGIDITSFVNEIVNSSEPGVQTMLVDRDGAITAHRDRKYVLHNSTARGADKTTVYDLIGDETGRSALKQVLGRLTAGAGDVEALPLTVDGRRYLAAATYLKEIRWLNLVLVDAAHVVSYRDFLPILLTTILSLLAVTVAVGVLLNRLVLNRLSSLAHSSERIASGDFDIKMPVTAFDEIGALTRSFNEMARMVKDHTENLERKVSERTEELGLANRKLAESNEQILDSIRYARLIQASILPDESAISRCTNGFFALYLPRDVVGGDFYALREWGEHRIIAVADCTGHGVPGAFMTMTANAVLDHVLDTIGSHDPAAILKELDRRLRATLHGDAAGHSTDNGLDIGLCCWAPATGRIVFAGARVDLHSVAGGSLVTIPGDRQPIGYRDANPGFVYANHVVEPGDGAIFYMASDGILDQSGGPKGLGFGRRRFGELLQAVAGLPIAEQAGVLGAALAEYQGDQPQRDDITVIGFRL